MTMTVLFDTAVIIPALVDQLPNHEAAFAAYARFSSDPERACCSTHALAECYAVLTTLPLPRRILPDEARRLVEESVSGRLDVIELGSADYAAAMEAVSSRGAGSGIVYDALHVQAAVKAGCTRIYSYNLPHFRLLCPRNIELATP